MSKNGKNESSREVPATPDPNDLKEHKPLNDMVFSWLVYIMVPAAVVAWSSTKQWTAALGAALATPVVAILQGSVGILWFRVHFGDAPLPITPSHGVVVVNPDEKKQPLGGSNDTRTLAGLSTCELLSDGCSCTPSNQSAAELLPHSDRLPCEVQEPPLRLLVIGDSLAIGVGQSKSCTPILPEVIAKTLSKGLGGRVVYWTCHGAPGASAGWIVRELERGVSHVRESSEDDELDSLPDKMEVQSSCSDTDSSSDESSTGGTVTFSKSGVVAANDEAPARNRTLSQWRDKLEQHRKRFNPHVLGPYDVVIVLTGSNDLKSAFFPFLLTGEDAEFRRQAQQRGGNYTNELRRLVDTLNQKMRTRLQAFRETVEGARETVREKVEETMERIAPGSSSRLSPRKERKTLGKAVFDFAETDMARQSSAAPQRMPLVVLPGMPARALPIFQSRPLRWLAVPIVDIMDTHKRKLARSHPGQVLFVKAPSVPDLANYESKVGEIWEQRCREETLLSLRDIRKHECKRIEAAMGEYYRRKNQTDSDDKSPRRKGLLSKLRRGPAPGTSLFSVDQIHPRDAGYDFWGRFIAQAIVEELSNKKNL